jgi:hypothetical protein
MNRHMMLADSSRPPRSHACPEAGPARLRFDLHLPLLEVLY